MSYNTVPINCNLWGFSGISCSLLYRLRKRSALFAREMERQQHIRSGGQGHLLIFCRIRLGKGHSLSFVLPSRLIQMDFFGSIGSTPAHFPLTTRRLLPKYNSTTHTPSSQAPYLPTCTTTTTKSIWLPSSTPSSMTHV